MSDATEPSPGISDFSTNPRWARVERAVGRPTTRLLAHGYDVGYSAAKGTLTSEGRRSWRLLRTLRDAYRGRTSVIVGNGPSLRQTDLSLLNGEIVFGLNRIYLNDAVTPTFHVAVNRLVVEQCAEDLRALQTPLFTTWANADLLPGHPNAVFLKGRVGRPVSSTNPMLGVHEGSTVTFVAMQLAYFMGFSRVVLIGVDHRFSTQGPAHQTVTATGDDPNHFDPKYFANGFRWQLPDLEGSERAYRLARSRFAAAGRETIDATVGGALEVFQKSDLASALRRT